MRILVLTLMMSFLSHSAFGASTFFDINLIFTTTNKSVEGGGAVAAEGEYAFFRRCLEGWRLTPEIFEAGRPEASGAGDLAEEAEGSDALADPNICLPVPADPTTINDLLRCFQEQSQAKGCLDACRGVFNRLRLSPKKR
jgi:hypothetical protein